MWWFIHRSMRYQPSTLQIAGFPSKCLKYAVAALMRKLYPWKTLQADFSLEQPFQYTLGTFWGSKWNIFTSQENTPCSEIIRSPCCIFNRTTSYTRGIMLICFVIRGITKDYNFCGCYLLQRTTSNTPSIRHYNPTS